MSEYAERIAQLESLYTPAWNVNDWVGQTVKSTGCERQLLDVGCADAQLAWHLPTCYAHYVGLDRVAPQGEPFLPFRPKTQIVLDACDLDACLDAAIPTTTVSSFSLHEVGVAAFCSILPQYADEILVIDIATHDLPKLHGNLGEIGVRTNPDPRDAIERLGEVLGVSGWRVRLDEVSLRIAFPTRASIEMYDSLFDLRSGADSGVAVSEQAFLGVLSEFTYPFLDDRHFSVLHCDREDRCS